MTKEDLKKMAIESFTICNFVLCASILLIYNNGLQLRIDGHVVFFIVSLSILGGIGGNLLESNLISILGGSIGVVIGIVIGYAIGYFIYNSNVLGGVGSGVGAIIGYFIGIFMANNLNGVNKYFIVRNLLIWLLAIATIPIILN